MEGIPCVLADRSSFPRIKVCGGVLSGRASRLLTESGMLSPAELQDLTVQTHTGMTISSDFRTLHTFKAGKPPVRMVNRTEFDAFLRRRALEEGAVPLCDNFMNLTGNTAIFKSGNKIGFSRLIGADGASSRVRRSIRGGRFLRPSPAFSSVVPLSGTAIEPFLDRGLQIFFFKGLTGYGWLFPRREDIVAGLGSFAGSGKNAVKLMTRLMVHSGLGTSHGMTGALLPAGRQPVSTGRGAVLLAGDAAGLCDRVSGEGISHALESGLAAAEAVIRKQEAWGAGSECVEMVKKSLRYRRLLYREPFRTLAMKALSGSDKWYGKYWGIVSGSKGYGDLLRS